MEIVNVILLRYRRFFIKAYMHMVNNFNFLHKIKILKYVFFTLPTLLTLPPPPKIQLKQYIFIYNTYIHIYIYIDIHGYAATE